MLFKVPFLQPFLTSKLYKFRSLESILANSPFSHQLDSNDLEMQKFPRYSYVVEQPNISQKEVHMDIIMESLSQTERKSFHKVLRSCYLSNSLSRILSIFSKSNLFAKISFP